MNEYIVLDVAAHATHRSGVTEERIVLKQSRSMILTIEFRNGTLMPFTTAADPKHRYAPGVKAILFKAGVKMPRSDKYPDRESPPLFTLQAGESVFHDEDLSREYRIPLDRGSYKVQISYEVGAGSQDATPASLEKWVELEIIE